AYSNDIHSPSLHDALPILKIIQVAKTNGTLKFGTSCSVNLTTPLKILMNHFRIRTLILGWGLNGLFRFLKMRQLTLKPTSLCHRSEEHTSELQSHFDLVYR